MNLRTVIVAVAIVGASIPLCSAHADVIVQVDMAFESGATFSGQVAFIDDFSRYVAVTGTLYGYEYGTSGYAGSGADSINWVWDDGINYSIGSKNYSSWLMDGTDHSNYYNFIQLAYNYSGAPELLFTSGVSFVDGQAFDNYINFSDPMISASLSVVPGPIAGAGLPGFILASAGLVGRWRRRRKLNLTC
jgi:hypothetical protein